ncbi:MAG: recombination mediator RecR [Acholeplasmatales bacterium]|jgi:recombination protein RecR|nr:recombination mediator RecR [Acholeplasmatales bacterium]
MYPNTIINLINDFKKIPSIGEKSAERFVLHIISKYTKTEIEDFSKHLLEINSKLKKCPVCGMLIDTNSCYICEDKSRHLDTLMIVSEIKDVYLIERTNAYHGLYHVLGGEIDYSRGIDEKKLAIETLIVRLKETKEVILALNNTLQGELTSKYLKALLEKSGIKVTKLASGIPYGTDLRYTDELTLKEAFNNRKEF